MADETKETNVAETASETPKKKRDWKGKRLPIVIAAVVAVTVLGVAGWAWRATPGYCDALCHSTMGKYYDTFENQTDSLAFAHKGVVNGKCLDCHENTLGTSVRMAQSLSLIHISSRVTMAACGHEVWHRAVVHMWHARICHSHE